MATTKVTSTSTTLGDEAADPAFDEAVREARAAIGEHGLIIDGEPRRGHAGT